SSLNPLRCRILICLKIVVFPHSDPPSRRILNFFWFSAWFLARAASIFLELALDISRLRVPAEAPIAG
ncbi:hypothetical protein PMAYCL1PPCAC_32636, partial [Pristionchus mayeri]